MEILLIFFLFKNVKSEVLFFHSITQFFTKISAEPERNVI